MSNENKEFSRAEALELVKNSKRKKRSKKTNIIIGLICSGILVTGAIEAASVMSIYNSSKEWQKKSNTPIASLEPYMLYLSKKDMDNLSEYTSTLSKFYDSNKGTFSEKANNKDFDKLQKEFNKLAQSLKEREQEKFTLVSNMWHMKSDYDSMWKDSTHTTLAEATTPTTVSDYVDKYWKTMDSYLENDSIQKEWLTNTYNEILKLRDDTAGVTNLFGMFDKTFTVSSKKVLVKKDISSSNLTNWNETLQSLNYKWPIVSEYMNSIVNHSSTILAKHDKAINLYNEYSEASENKKAFDNWTKKYNDYNNSLIDVPNFIGKDVEVVKAWAKENGITLIINKVEDTAKKDSVIAQTPNISEYSKIIKGSSMTINIAKEIPKPSSSSSSSTTKSSSSSSSDSKDKTQTESSTSNKEAH